MYVGSDTDQLRSTAGALDGFNRQVEELARTVSQLADGLEWAGLDADTFRMRTRVALGSATCGVRQQLELSSLVLRFKANVQDTVSATLGGTGSGASPSGGTSTTEVATLREEAIALLEQGLESSHMILDGVDLKSANIDKFDKMDAGGLMLGGLSVFGSMLSAMLPEGVGRDSVEFGTELTNIAGGALGITKGALQLAQHITPELSALSKVGGAFAIAGGAIGLYHDIQSFKDGVNATDVISTVSDTAKIVGGVMVMFPLTAPIGGIILGVSAIADAGVWLYNNQEKVAHVAEAVSQGVSQAVTEVAQVANEVSHVAESVVSSVTSTVTSSVTNTFHALGGFFK